MVTRREFVESVDKKDGPRSQPKFNEDGSRNQLYGYPRGVGESIPDTDGALDAGFKMDERLEIEVPEYAKEEHNEPIPDPIELGIEGEKFDSVTLDDIESATGKEEPVEKSIDEQIADLEAQKAELKAKSDE